MTKAVKCQKSCEKLEYGRWDQLFILVHRKDNVYFDCLPKSRNHEARQVFLYYPIFLQKDFPAKKSPPAKQKAAPAIFFLKTLAK